MFDLAQATDVLVRIEAGPPWGAAGLEETDALVLAQRRGVHLDETSRDTDDVECIRGPQAGLARRNGRNLMRVAIHFVCSTSYTLDDVRAI